VKPLARAIGTVLRDARRARGLSQEKVAEFAGFDRTYPSLLERGLREPGLSAFLRLCAAVDRSPHELLGLTLGTASSTPAAGRSPKLPSAGHVAIQPVRIRLRREGRSLLQGLQAAQEPPAGGTPAGGTSPEMPCAALVAQPPQRPRRRDTE
jgi:transcriptional regulator with XRE-family HTH domain